MSTELSAPSVSEFINVVLEAAESHESGNHRARVAMSRKTGELQVIYQDLPGMITLIDEGMCSEYAPAARGNGCSLEDQIQTDTEYLYNELVADWEAAMER